MESLLDNEDTQTLLQLSLEKRPIKPKSAKELFAEQFDVNPYTPEIMNNHKSQKIGFFHFKHLSPNNPIHQRSILFWDYISSRREYDEKFVSENLDYFWNFQVLLENEIIGFDFLCQHLDRVDDEIFKSGVLDEERVLKLYTLMREKGFEPNLKNYLDNHHFMIKFLRQYPEHEAKVEELETDRYLSKRLRELREQAIRNLEINGDCLERILSFL